MRWSKKKISEVVQLGVHFDNVFVFFDDDEGIQIPLKAVAIIALSAKDMVLAHHWIMVW